MDSSAVRELGVLSVISFAAKHADLLANNSTPAINARAPVVRAAVSGLELAYGASRPLRALWSLAVKAKDAADDDLDDTISALSYDLLGPSILKGDRDAADYRVLFPEGNIDFINGPDRAELAQVNAIASHLEQTPTHPMAGRATLIRQKAAVMDAAMGPVAAAETTYRNSLAVQRARKEAVVRVLRKNVRFLRDQLDGDEAKVDALFPTVAECKTKEEYPDPMA